MSDARHRHCPHCGGLLRRTNPGPLCSPCTRAARDTTARLLAGHGRAPLTAEFYQRAAVATAVGEHDFGALFRLARAELGMSQEAFGDLIDKPQSRICRIEVGRLRLDSLDDVVRVANALRIPPALLGFHAPEPAPDTPTPHATTATPPANANANAYGSSTTTAAATPLLGTLILAGHQIPVLIDLIGTPIQPDATHNGHPR